MACCIAIAFVFGVLRAAWFKVSGRTPVEVGFAPPAYRAAPGGAVGATVAASRQARRPEAARRPGAAIARGIAVGTLSYTAVVAVLLVSGLADATPGSSWLARDVALVLLAATALTVALALHSPDLTHRRVTLATIGATWVELGLVDMHLLGLFDFPHHPALLDLVFHGSGFALLAVAVPSLARRTGRRTPSRKVLA